MPDARPVEDRFYNDRAAEQRADRDARQRDHDNHDVLEHVAEEDLPLGYAACAQTDDVVLVQLVERRRANLADVARGHDQCKRERRQNHADRLCCCKYGDEAELE